MAQPKITLIKKFQYRGNDEEWSNSYNLDTAPTSRSNWLLVAGDFIGWEVACFGSATSIVQVLCYADADNPVTESFDSTDLSGSTLTGQLTEATGQPFAGDQASVVSVKTGKTNSKGKPIYLRKYFHGGQAVSGSDAADAITSDLSDALQDLGDSMVTKHWGGLAYVTDPQGDRPAGPANVDPWVTTRTLKRRGKRPS